MIKTLRTVILFSLTCILLSCDNKLNQTKVLHKGALRTMMSGNLSSMASMDSMSQKKNLYALGALEGLKGEIQIFDSEPFISKVSNKTSIDIENSFNHEAALLVYSEVSEWTDPIDIPEFSSNKELENAIKKIAKENRIDVSQPFPFLLKGTALSLDWHVINWPENDTIHNHQKHQESGRQGNLTDQEVDIIGFYSEKHKGIFTHHSTFLHMHFKTLENQAIAGHVDNITGDSMQLLLSKR